jgi:hypothetical protein
MATATTQKPKAMPSQSVLTELEQREAAVAELAAAEREAGARARQAAEELKALRDERHRLLTREPGLFDHRGGANVDVENNPVTLVDEAIAKSADVGDLVAQYEHRKRLRSRGEQGVKDWTRARADALAEALAPMLNQQHIEAQARLDEAAEAVATLASLGRRYEVLTGGRLSGLEHLGNLVHLIERNGVPQVTA